MWCGKGRLRRNSGFSVLEMLVTIVLLTMLGATFVALIIHSIRGWSSGSSKANAATAADTALHKLYQDIRVGSAASVASGQLTVTVPALITDGQGETYYDRTAATTSYNYYLSNGILYRQIGAGTAKIFARDISAITFSVSGGVVTVAVTGRNQTGTSQSEQQETAQVVMRNYRG